MIFEVNLRLLPRIGIMFLAIPDIDSKKCAITFLERNSISKKVMISDG